MTYAFRFSAASQRNLKTVHPDLAQTVELALQCSHVDFAVFESLRSTERQRRLLQIGASQTMQSRHLRQPDGWAHAVDLVPWLDGQLLWAWKPIYFIAYAMRTAAARTQCSITWGGVWDRDLQDLPGHAPTDMAAARAAYEDRHPGKDFLDGAHFQITL